MKIVLLPGLDGTGNLFDPLLKALPQNLEVIVISYPETKLGYEELVSFVLGQLPTDDYVLVGESFSGNIAYQIAQTKPKHLKYVIFVASFLSNPRPLLLKLFNQLPSSLLSVKPPQIIIKIFMLGFSANKNSIQLFLETLKQVPSDVLSFRLKEIGKLQLRPEPCEIKATYIQATNDYLVPSKALKDFEQLFSNLTVVKVKGSHFILQSQPIQCADIIKNTI
ncbi:alpha/beta fold hydrolase [uncultured Cocleimonas sp.]|uniref:alpha/beta fold hydrolase n=1 Tax=uncultured Cocleimonas sp. TaxID=1051587 RepID=UPI00261620E8|nr:alpha/beta hydrolase [uncultured Cocleimonas sp.]